MSAVCSNIFPAIQNEEKDIVPEIPEYSERSGGAIGGEESLQSDLKEE